MYKFAEGLIIENKHQITKEITQRAEYYPLHSVVVY